LPLAITLLRITPLLFAAIDITPLFSHYRHCHCHYYIIIYSLPLLFSLLPLLRSIACHYYIAIIIIIIIIIIDHYYCWFSYFHFHYYFRHYWCHWRHYHYCHYIIFLRHYYYAITSLRYCRAPLLLLIIIFMPSLFSFSHHYCYLLLSLLHFHITPRHYYYIITPLLLLSFYIIIIIIIIAITHYYFTLLLLIIFIDIAIFIITLSIHATYYAIIAIIFIFIGWLSLLRHYDIMPLRHYITPPLLNWCHLPLRHTPCCAIILPLLLLPLLLFHAIFFALFFDATLLLPLLHYYWWFRRHYCLRHMAPLLPLLLITPLRLSLPLLLRHIAPCHYHYFRRHARIAAAINIIIYLLYYLLCWHAIFGFMPFSHFASCSPFLSLMLFIIDHCHTPLLYWSPLRHCIDAAIIFIDYAIDWHYAITPLLSAFDYAISHYAAIIYYYYFSLLLLLPLHTLLLRSLFSLFSLRDITIINIIIFMLLLILSLLRLRCHYFSLIIYFRHYYYFRHYAFLRYIIWLLPHYFHAITLSYWSLLIIVLLIIYFIDIITWSFLLMALPSLLFIRYCCHYMLIIFHYFIHYFSLLHILPLTPLRHYAIIADRHYYAAILSLRHYHYYYYYYYFRHLLITADAIIAISFSQTLRYYATDQYHYAGAATLLMPCWALSHYCATPPLIYFH